MTTQHTRLTVERVDTISRRPSRIFVTGTLEGGPLHIGDSVVIDDVDRAATHTVIRSIEVHTAPGRATITLDAALKAFVRSGVVISRSE